MSEAVVIWGEVLWDRFPDGDQLGGAPANVAWHLGQAGGWPQLISRVGNDDDGRRALAQLAALVDVDLVQIDDSRPTGEVTVELIGGEPRYTLHAGRAWERIACTPDVTATIASAGVVVYGTLAQRTAEGFASWQRAIAATTDRCLRACDLNLRPGQARSQAIDAAIAAADLLKLNDRELAIVGEWLATGDPIATLRTHTRVIAVTHGAAGATLYGESGDPIRIAGVVAAPGGDNVGCGDAFLAIMIFGLTSGWDLAASGRAAARYAAAVAGRRGATPTFTSEQLDELLGEWS